jgi:hypothetical protein
MELYKDRPEADKAATVTDAGNKLAAEWTKF